MAIGLAACGSARTAPVVGSAGEWQPRAADCATKETFVEAGDSALEGMIVDCMTGQKIPGVTVIAMGATDTAKQREAISDASGRYRLQLPEGRYRVSILEYLDLPEVEIEIRAQHATVKEMRLDLPSCPPKRGSSAVVRQADLDALIAAVLDHYAAGGIVDAPPRSDPEPTYVTIKDPSTLALPPDYARQYIFTTEDELQREAMRSGRDIPFIHIFGFEIDGSCATVSVGGDFVTATWRGTLCCCEETEVFLKRGDRWVFRTSRVGVCS